MDEELYDKLVILDNQFTKLLPLLHEKANKADSVPVGTIVYIANNKEGKPVIPKGYLYCDGSEISRTVYHQLFEAIGEVGGPGDGVLTFNLPDLRDMFIRGWDNRKADKRFIGSVQQDAMRSITGEFGMLNNSSATGAFTTATKDSHKHMVQRTTSYSDTGVRFDNALVTRVAEENRPINQAWIPVIKYMNYYGTDATFYSDSNDLFVKGRVYSYSTQQGGAWPDRTEPVKGIMLTSYVTVMDKTINSTTVDFMSTDVVGTIKAMIGDVQEEVRFGNPAIQIYVDENAKRVMKFILDKSLQADTVTLIYNHNWVPLVHEGDNTYILRSEDVIALFLNNINKDNQQLQFKTFYKDK